MEFICRVISLFILIQIIKAHSWLECTNYEGDLKKYDPTKCKGLPRPLDSNGRNVGNGPFGQDIGMDYRPAASGNNPCQGDSTIGTAGNYPKGVVEYERGKTYTLAWPPKNHAAATCTNAFIPDNFLKILAVPYTEKQKDPNQSEFRKLNIPSSFEKDPHVRGVIDFKGFQNCPNFCDDTDKSLCTGTITIPSNLPVGQLYTLQWYWAFNSPTDLYATCWEAKIINNTGTGTGTGAPVTTPKPITPACPTCCSAGEIQAPGTGAIVKYNVLANLGRQKLLCPSGFKNEFTVMCIDKNVRLVDGFCELTNTPNAGAVTSTKSSDSEDQSGAVIGLSLTLVIVILAFIMYFMFVNKLFCFDDGQSPKRLDDDYTGKSAVAVERKRIPTVSTLSNTVLPVAPDTPASSNWYYTDINNGDQTVGPVSDSQLAKYCRQIGFNNAVKKVNVWNGENVLEWVSLNEVPGLEDKLRAL